MATTKKTSTASAAKAAVPKASAAKSSPADKPAAAEGDAAPAAARVKAPSLRIKDLVTRVSEATGGKRKGVKELVEATLHAVGDALARGEDLNLPGIGRTRIARTAEKDGASLMTLKVRRAPHRPKAAKEALADDGEDS